jgi:hypothetical protein
MLRAEPQNEPLTTHTEVFCINVQYYQADED